MSDDRLKVRSIDSDTWEYRARYYLFSFVHLSTDPALNLEIQDDGRLVEMRLRADDGALHCIHRWVA